MPCYLMQVAYTPEAWSAQLKAPQNRIDTVRPVVKKFGGKFVDTYYCFGEYDVVAIIDMPDNTAAAAFSLIASAGGAVKSVKTTPLMTIDEGMQAMRKGAEAAPLYRAPAAQVAAAV